MGRNKKHKHRVYVPTGAAKQQQPTGQAMSNNQRAVDGNIRQMKEVPGFMACVLTSKISETKAEFQFHIKIPHEVWHEVLAFFKWSYDTYKSETQVRLYVNPEQKTWKAWAYPQEANTGMSARELDSHERYAPQRAQFGADWLYYGTVHHHCSTKAFQSSVDEANEKDQDGIHITVGELDRTRYDLHVRLYQSGLKFVPSLSQFWDVSHLKAQVPSFLVGVVPDDNVLALWDMSQPAPEGTEFPQEWRDNIIHVPKPETPPFSHVGPSRWDSEYDSMAVYVPDRTYYIERSKKNYEIDFRRARAAIKKWLEKKNDGVAEKDKLDIRDVWRMLETLEALFDDEAMELFDLLCYNDSLPGPFLNYWQKMELAKLNLKEAEKAKEKSGGVSAAGAAAPIQLKLPHEKPKGKPPEGIPFLDKDGFCKSCTQPWPYHTRQCVHNVVGNHPTTNGINA